MAENRVKILLSNLACISANMYFRWQKCLTEVFQMILQFLIKPMKYFKINLSSKCCESKLFRFIHLSIAKAVGNIILFEEFQYTN